MINPYEWEEYYLLVSIRNRTAVEGYLLNHVSQEQFFEKFLENNEGMTDRNKRPNDITVCRLTEDSFETLRGLYDDTFIVEG